MSRQQFADQLLADEKQVLGRFDTRSVDGSARPSGRAATVNRYLRSALGFTTDLAYQGNESGYSPETGQRTPAVSARWNYNQGPPAASAGAFGGSEPGRPARRRPTVAAAGDDD